MPYSDQDNSGAAFPFGELVNDSSIIYYHCSLESGFPVRYMSPNVKKILGFEADKFKKDAELWTRQIHDADRAKVLSSYENILETEQSVIEFRFRHKEGHYIWLRDEIKLLKDEQGEPESIVGSSIEITEQKEAEKELRELNATLEERIKERTSKLATANRKLKKQIQQREKAEQKLKEQHETLKLQELAIDNLNDMVVVTKAPTDEPLKSKIIFVNKAFEDFTGYTSAEVEGRQPTFLHGPQTSEEVLSSIKEKIKAHEPLREEFINYKKDGTPYWVELDMSPFPTDDDDFKYWVGINRDITKRKEAEQKLEQSEKRYRAIAELSFDAIFELDLDGTILNFNRRATELFGYSPEELSEMNAMELIPEEYRDKYPEMISEAVTTDNKAVERTYKRKDGSTFPTEIHTQLYEIGDEKRLIAYVRDNTAHKKFEEEIQKSLKEKEMLLSEVHHRVKNNLAIISGLLEMQVFNTDDKKLLAKLKESQSRIQSIAMVHEKLYSSESFSEIAIDKYIDDLLDMLVDSMDDLGKRISVEKNMDPVKLAVRQAIPCGLLLNELITNAYKHAFEDRDEGTIYIGIKQQNGSLTLEVIDNGIGLPDDFSMADQSSLGMTLVSTLVRQLEGDLEVSSDNGACFSVTFEIEN